MTDNLDTCANCGHIEYHHRPECTHRDFQLYSGGTRIDVSDRCGCLSFVEQTGDER